MEKRVGVNQYSFFILTEHVKQDGMLDPEMVAVRAVPGRVYGASCDGESRVKLRIVGKDPNLKLPIACAEC